MLKLLVVLSATLLLSAAAFAQVPPDVYQVGYAANLNIGDSIVNITNAGSEGGFEPSGNICANVYVFDPDQQLIACCACPLTPNHLKNLSVKNDLISNTLTPGVPTSVTVAIAATKGGTCNAALGNIFGTPPQGVSAAAGLRAWFVTIHQGPTGDYNTTENEFSPAPISPTQGQKLLQYCGFIQANGSGFGICRSCRQGAQGADRR